MPFNLGKLPYRAKIKALEVHDVRFPTSFSLDGSDAVHTDPDYSAAYVIITTDQPDVDGHGYTFTIGRGTDIVCHAIRAYAFLLEGKEVGSIFKEFGSFWHSIVMESQLRWLGPEKGVVQLAVAAIVNALWDMWACIEGLPLWKLIATMSPEEIVSTIDFRYITDVITPEEAIALLSKNAQTAPQREKELLETGLPAYITSVGWMGYSNEKISRLCDEALADGWTRFKMKVGVNLEDDQRRAKLIREKVGKDKLLMADANQRWDVGEAIRWMDGLKQFGIYWIEEPTSPDDVEAHRLIAEAVRPWGIRVATGEHCQNRVLFKQFLQRGAMDVCQLDSCRVGGLNEILSILLLAAKFRVPVCPHAGGVGLCELVQHLAAVNYLLFAPSLDGVMVEFADHLHEHFEDQVRVKNGSYLLPLKPGYARMKPTALAGYRYPDGGQWQLLFEEGKVSRPHCG